MMLNISQHKIDFLLDNYFQHPSPKMKWLTSQKSTFKKLKILNLENNHLKKLPKSIGNLTELEEFGISGNTDLVSPPYHIARRGIEAIANWFERSESR